MHDLKTALRQLVKSPGFTVVAVLILALGIGGGISVLLAGVIPFDPVVLLTASVLLAAVVVVACLAPARRAARLNVLDVLRAE